MRLSPTQDAMGRAVLDRYQEGTRGYEIVERSDGVFAPSGGPGVYLAPYATWPRHERSALREARGRVLDIGCNAGRHAIHLQERGHEVVGIDVSPLALRTARLRGLEQTRLLSITQIDGRLGTFDTILMLGMNFGLFANRARAQWLLRKFRGLTSDRARILAESQDIYRTREPLHLRYQASNRRRGRMSGQLRIRVRYQNLVTPWFDYLTVSKQEMEEILEGTGWRVLRYYDGPAPRYIAVLGKRTA